MLQKINKRLKGQSTAEYAILIGLVIAAAVAMQIYVKRGLQARVHDASQVLVRQTSNAADGLAASGQYEPYYIRSDFNVIRSSAVDSRMETTGVVASDDYSSTRRLDTGYQRYTNVQQE